MRRPRKACVLDTNVLVRHLLQDDPAQSRLARALFRRVESGEERVELTDVVLAETVWVLEKTFGVPRSEIARSLAAIVSLHAVRQPLREANVEALESFARTRCDIVDCLLAARARARQTEVYSFDSDFDSLGCRRREP